MPNYLAGDIAPEGLLVEKDGTLRIVSDISELQEASDGTPPSGFQITKSGEYKIKDDKSNFENLSNKASIKNDFTGLQRVENPLFGFNGPGTKPEALHTEFAGESTGGPAYGTQDLVFYLERCGSGGGGGGSSYSVDSRMGFFEPDVEPGAGRARVWDDSSSSMVPIGANGRSGPVPDSGQLQSGMNQIALGRMGLGSTTGGPMAPFSGFDIDGQEDLGEITQHSPKFSDIDVSLVNAVKRVKELSQSLENFGLGSSEKLFSGVLNENFNPGFDYTTIRTDEDILDTFSRSATSELSFLLARETRGRIRNRDIVTAINDGKLGRLTQKSRSFQSRMGNPGRAPK